MANKALTLGSILFAYNAVGTHATGGGGFDGNAGLSFGGGIGGDAGASIGSTAGAGANSNLGGEAEFGIGGGRAFGNDIYADFEADGASSGDRADIGASANTAGNANGEVGDDSFANTASPSPEVDTVPENDAGVYVPADSAVSSSAREHRIASALMFTASASQGVQAPQYTIQGGAAKVLYFPPNAATTAGGEAPEAGVTPAPGNKESSPINGKIGLGADGLLTTMGTVLNPVYVYISFSTLFAGYEADNEMKTIGPNFANTVLSFHSDAMSTRCASTMAPGATPSYGPPAAINWSDLNASSPDGGPDCWNIAPPAEFLKACPPEWNQQLDWNVQFDPPQMLMKEEHPAAKPPMSSNITIDKASSALSTAAIMALTTANCTSCSYFTGAPTAATIGSFNASIGSNGTVVGTTSAPLTGGSGPNYGQSGLDGWGKVVAGSFVAVLTLAAFL